MTAVLVGISCLGRSGDADEGPQQYRAYDRSFAISYVSPPWHVDEEGSDNVRLSIPAEVFGVALEGSPPTHVMIAGLSDLAASLEDLLQIGPEDIEDLLGTSADWTSLTGWTGWTGWTGVTGWTGFPEDTGETGDGPDWPEIPDYLLNVDLRNPRDVAYAEMSFLIEEREARVVSAMQTFVTIGGQRGVVYEVALDPGVFVRTFYFRTSRTASRVVFISLFELQTGDIDLMAATIETDGGIGGV